VPNYSLTKKPQKVFFHKDSRTVAMKSESAKDRVTTHLPNEKALKMDGAKANDLYMTTQTSTVFE